MPACRSAKAGAWPRSARSRPLSVGELAQRANLDKGQASRAAQALADQGLVSKTADRHDGRGVSLRLTAKGRQRWRAVMALIERRNDEIFGDLDTEERRRFGAMLDRLVAKARDDLEGAADASPPPRRRPLHRR